MRPPANAATEAALASLSDAPREEAESVRAELQAERQIAALPDEGNGPSVVPAQALRAKALAARRNRLLAMRRDNVIGDEAFHRIEEELDLAELALTGPRGSLPKAKER